MAKFNENLCGECYMRSVQKWLDGEARNFVSILSVQAQAFLDYTKYIIWWRLWIFFIVYRYCDGLT